ncbi:unnamed protein product [Pieris macdunnoughi]|uniref:Uncharacterized protein n=1 Tax=Pieris macdunnoughi TaxID=345717 RepID=A0A821NBL1_9NEOP|nr:unnamed protein product [Pieris macdunnoughi]
MSGPVVEHVGTWTWNSNNGEYATRSLPRVRIDGGQAGNPGVRLRCWAAPPSITEEEAEDEIEEDAVSLRALPVQGNTIYKLVRLVLGFTEANMFSIQLVLIDIAPLSRVHIKTMYHLKDFNPFFELSQLVTKTLSIKMKKKV